MLLHMRNLIFSLIVVLIGSSCYNTSTANGGDKKEPPTVNPDIISVKDNMFYLDGKPLVEISFNKFDLFWSVYGATENGEVISKSHPMVVRQQKALSDLHKAGFRTIRFFGSVHDNFYKSWREVWLNPTLRNDIFYKSMDTVLDLCEKYDISAVFSLGVAMFVEEGETRLNLIADPNSKSRKALYEYLDEFIPRYKGHKAIGMWEITNELTNIADLPNSNDSPTMQQVAQFLKDVTARIKQHDPERIVTKGGSALREYAYGLNNGRGWKQRDTYDEQCQIFSLIHKDTGLDVMDIHYYVQQDPRYRITDNEGNPFVLTLKEHKKIADALGMPMYVGEYGALPKTKNEKNEQFWEDNPDWFETFGNDEPQAIYWVQKAADDAAASGIPLIHWWCYQSDRARDQKDPMRMDLDIERTPKLFQIVVEANKQLKKNFGIDN